MTREEAILEFETMLAKYAFEADEAQAIGKAFEALRPASREQVERMRGEWIGFRGEKVEIDEYGCPVDWAMCSVCREYLTASEEYSCNGHFCPNCGAPMTDEAVEKVMERLEALYETT